MPKKDNKTLKHNHGEKSMRTPFIIYADIESLLEKMSTCHNNPKKSSITKIDKHEASGYSLFRHCSFDVSKNKLDYYRDKDCMKKFCKDLIKHAIKTIDCEIKRKIPLTIEESKSYCSQNVCGISKKGLSIDDDNKKYHKVRYHCDYTGKYRGAARNICNLRYKTPKEIPVIFHYNSKYDYHFIIKELTEEFEGQFEVLGENTEKYITFSVPIKKELDNGKTITYKIKFFESFRFISSSLSNLVDSLSEGLHCDNCINCKSYLDYVIPKDDQFIFRCFEYKKNYKKKINKDLIKKFAST